MPAGDFFAGAVLFAAMLAAALGGSWLLLRRRLPWLRGAEAATAFALIAVLGVLAIHLAPAVLGVLGRGSVLVAAALWLALCWRAPRTRAEPPPLPRAEPRDPYARYGRPLAWVGAGLTGLFFLAFVANQIVVPVGSIDFGTFHLPNVIRWMQSGSIWQVDNFLPAVAPGNYPNNGDVLLLAFVLPWHNDFLAHGAMWAAYALTGLAMFALARRLGASLPVALMAACLLLAIPAVAVSAMRQSLTDSLMLFGFAAGLLFLVRHHRSGATAELVLAGLALGLSFGTKWYGVSSVAIVVAVWALARLLAGRGLGTVLRQGAALVGLIALAGGVWLLRNWIESGNPVFPVRVAPFGVEIFAAPPDVTREQFGFTIADYLTDATAWREFILPQLRSFLAAPAGLALVGGLAALAVAVVRRGARGRGVALALAACCALLLAAYTITPYTAGGPEGMPILVGADSRYAVPAIVVALALAAWGAGRVRWGGLAFTGIGLLALLHGIGKSGGGELNPVPVGRWDFAFAIAFVIGVAGLAWAFEPWARRLWRSSLRVPGTALGLAAVFAVVAVVGNEVQARFNRDRYVGGDAVIDAVIERAPAGARIGLAGAWNDAGLSPVLPSFGPRFENEVEYVGPLVEEMQQRYEERAGFVAALERGDYDLLIVGRGRPELPPIREGDWAESAGWEPVAESERFELYAAP
ncbi:MAG TPA: phospholipid carrier-dependent glycosyltransferase [Solirubrobacterales bacterium]|jgi:hypothetical protein